jgi:hypothetical protein
MSLLVRGGSVIGARGVRRSIALFLTLLLVWGASPFPACLGGDGEGAHHASGVLPVESDPSAHAHGHAHDHPEPSGAEAAEDGVQPSGLGHADAGSPCGMLMSCGVAGLPANGSPPASPGLRAALAPAIAPSFPGISPPGFDPPPPRA